MSSAYRGLRPVQRLFVDGIVAGEKGTHVVRRLRPELKRPDVLASKWKRRADVQAAIAECQQYELSIEARLDRLERCVAALQRELAQRDETSAVMGSCEAVRNGKNGQQHSPNSALP